MTAKLDKATRRAQILDTAQQLFVEDGYSQCHMETIRLRLGLSRGGLYHHFSDKADVLSALVEREVSQLASLAENADAPFAVLLEAGSTLATAPQGVLAGLSERPERELYLAAFDRAAGRHLAPALVGAIHKGRQRGRYCPEGGNISPEHLTEMFLAINAHINRRVLLEDWRPSDAAAFSVSALGVLGKILGAQSELAEIIEKLQKAEHP